MAYLNGLLLLIVLFTAAHGQYQSPLGPPVRDRVLSAPTCPYRPIPVDLPDPLPNVIKKIMVEGISQLKNVLDSTRLPGIAVGLVYKDKVLYSDGIGVKNKSTNIAPDGDTIFRIGSVSKVFATLVLYQLYDRGLVQSLDDDITNYCPDFKMQTHFNTNTTLRQLASQMSGLPREAPCGSPLNQTTFCAVTTKDILNSLHSLRTLFPPWTKPSYSNLAYSLLGHCLIEHLFPMMTYEDYVIKNILAPLQMEDTGFKITDDVKARMATGYNVDGSEAPLTDLGWIGPAGQMYSTVNDLNKLAQFFMRDWNMVTPAGEKVLSSSLRREMLLPVYVNPDKETGFGTPWEILFANNYTINIKGGNVGGYSTLFSFVPDLKLGLSVVMSGAADELSIAATAYSLLIPAFIEALKPLQHPYPYPPNPSMYEGKYSTEIPGGPNITIETVNKQLVLKQDNLFVFYLSYNDTLHFQINYDFSGAVNPIEVCLQGELVALNKEWVYFAPADASGRSPKFTIPGVYLDLAFTRVG